MNRMTEYIERSKVIDLLHYNTDEACSAIVADVESIPASDVVPVVHGRWEPWFGNLVKCSVCGYEYVDRIECDNYCGNCGVKMDGGNTNA